MKKEDIGIFVFEKDKKYEQDNLTNDNLLKILEANRPHYPNLSDLSNTNIWNYALNKTIQYNSYALKIKEEHTRPYFVK